ncbi:MAG: lytic murein transglycosylase [Rhodospirillales bacterium]
MIRLSSKRELPLAILALVASALLLVATTLVPPAQAATAAFDDWVESLRFEARARGVEDEQFNRIFHGVQPIDRVVELDRRQPEFSQTFWRYLDARVTPDRIEQGRTLLADNGQLLAAVQRRYHVQPRFIVAFWGLESSYGDNVGDFPLVTALATLAWEGRRSAFFREQLLDLLQLIALGDIPEDARGSWAGAFGQMQFMPSTFRAYAVDFDGDGRRDLWNSLPDIFASAANYLASIGWDGESTWGREVVLPIDFDYTVSGLERDATLAEWSARGVGTVDGSVLPSANLHASLLLPGGRNGGPALLVYRNFRKIMNWNNSLLYAVSVGHLADRFAGGSPFATPRLLDEVPMSRTQTIEMQERLQGLGFDTGGADGRVGPKTRDAIMGFQQRQALPADGYPTVALLDQLRLVQPEVTGTGYESGGGQEQGGEGQ